MNIERLEKLVEVLQTWKPGELGIQRFTLSSAEFYDKGAATGPDGLASSHPWFIERGYTNNRSSVFFSGKRGPEARKTFFEISPVFSAWVFAPETYGEIPVRDPLVIAAKITKILEAHRSGSQVPVRLARGCSWCWDHPREKCLRGWGPKDDYDWYKNQFGLEFAQKWARDHGMGLSI